MIRIFCLLCVIGFSSQRDVISADEDKAFIEKNDLLRIVGGEKAEEGKVEMKKTVEVTIDKPETTFGEFPYQVSLRFRGLLKMHFCGGSIISEKVILTAAHCVTEVKVPPFSYVEVVAGTIDLKNEGPNVQKSTIIKSIVHPKYEGKVNPYDLAIHILRQSFTFNDYVQPVALPKPNEEPTGDGILTGWGSVSRSILPIMPDTLHKVTLPLMKYEECAEWYKKEAIQVHEMSNICTAPTKARFSACSGDSGGPLVSSNNGTNTIIGIVSWGQVPCGTGSPSVYTKVSSFVDFIQEKISLQQP